MVWVTLSAWKQECCKSSLLAEESVALVASTRLSKKYYFTAWQAATQRRVADESVEALSRQLAEGMQIAVACTSAALKQGYSLLLQHAWDAWIQALPRMLRLTTSGALSVPPLPLKTSWRREDAL
eukprot:g3166.t1